jgi:DNA-binding Xre family transcriptional regulator
MQIICIFDIMKTEKISRKRGLTSTGVKWVNDVECKRLNKTWLNYSGKIALRVLSAIEDIPGMNQRKLAELMGVTPQHISKIVKGQENLTLETIGKLSEALQIELVDFPKIKYS